MSELVSVGQIAKELGVDRGTVYQWMRRKADFPAPVGQVGNAAVYDLDAVKEWHRQVDLTPGRPRKAKKPAAKN